MDGGEVQAELNVLGVELADRLSSKMLEESTKRDQDKSPTLDDFKVLFKDTVPLVWKESVDHYNKTHPDDPLENSTWISKWMYATLSATFWMHVREFANPHTPNE